MRALGCYLHGFLLENWADKDLHYGLARDMLHLVTWRRSKFAKASVHSLGHHGAPAISIQYFNLDSFTESTVEIAMKFKMLNLWFRKNSKANHQDFIM